jgi:hypothetical protein
MADGDVDVRLTNSRSFNSNVFDGVDDYVEIPHHASQLGANLSNGFTISAWINPRSAGEIAGRIYDKSSAGNGTNGLAFQIFNNLLQVKINVSASISSAVNSVIYGKWTHVILKVNSSSQITFYKDGAISGTENQQCAQPISSMTAVNPARIGNLSGGTTQTWDGSIKDVKMWNRVLNTEEIAKDYAGLHTSEGCIHWFRLGGDYADYGSVGAVATNSGSTVAVIEDQVAAAIKAQRVITSADGKILTTEVNGKILSVGMVE